MSTKIFIFVVCTIALAHGLNPQKMDFKERLGMTRYRRAVSPICQEGCKGDTCFRGASGTVLREGQSLVSRNSKYRLRMQRDGNLVIYCHGSRVVWTTHTHGIHLKKGLYVQGDGNLILYTYHGKPVWRSGTHGTEVERFVMQNDGNFVGYGKYGTPYWSTGTHGRC
ncbi:uncharacterized protein [Clytia hemisphaerica]|uniref:uncharacterized protein n=1 Tax=Clytia hemisphaerica TaxID=252671 RepID=UPI0034D5177C